MVLDVLKLKHFRVFSVSETVTETRGCTRRDGKSDGCLFKEVDAGFMFYCLCSEDNCNAGEMTAASSLMLMISLVASIVLVKCA